MSPSAKTLIPAAVRLRAALEQTAEALVSPEIEALLACEAALEAAVTELPLVDDLGAAERALVAAELDGVRAAVRQCRQLGSALTDFVRLSLEAQGVGGGYGRPASIYAGQTLDQRI